MKEAIVVAIIGFLAVNVSEILKFLLRKWKRKTPVVTKDKSLLYIEFNKICNNIREDTNADGVYIAYYHNGGQYINGMKMDKYTVVGEDYVETLNSYKKQYQSVMISNVSYLTHCLLVKGHHTILDVSKDKSHDLSYIEDLKNRHIKTTHSFLINDPTKESPIGFVSLEYQHQNRFNYETMKGFIWRHQNKIANSINQMN